MVDTCQTSALGGSGISGEDTEALEGNPLALIRRRENVSEASMKHGMFIAIANSCNAEGARELLARLGELQYQFPATQGISRGWEGCIAQNLQPKIG
jgi:hypothetical protein